MTLTFHTIPVPLRTDVDGVVRIGTTRVTLDTVVGAFREGATAEEIAQRYPTLALEDVYATISYLLRHADEVDAYLAARQQQADAVRRENERRFDPAGVRDRLTSRHGTGGS